RSRILKIFAALRRSGRESDVVQKRLRALPSHPAPINLEGAAEQRPEGGRKSNQVGRTSTENFGRAFRDGAALAIALVDGRVRIDRHIGEPENLRRGITFIDRREREWSRAGGEENPLLHRCGEYAIRYYHETATAFCLP